MSGSLFCLQGAIPAWAAGLLSVALSLHAITLHVSSAAAFVKLTQPLQAAASRQAPYPDQYHHLASTAT